MATIEGTTEEIQTQENGQEVNWEQKYKELQSDYTKKSQELSEYKKQPKEQQEDLDDDSWKPAVKEAVRDDIYQIAEEIAEKKLRAREFDDYLTLNPDLKKFAPAIKDLAEKTGKSYDTIIDEYGFGSSDKLKKAKETRLLGDREYGEKQIDIKNIGTDDELDEYIKKHGGGSSYIKSVR